MTEPPELPELPGDGGADSPGEVVPRRSFVRWTGIFGVAALSPSIEDRLNLGSACSVPVEFPRNDLSLVNGVVSRSVWTPTVSVTSGLMSKTVEDGTIRMTGRRVGG